VASDYDAQREFERRLEERRRALDKALGAKDHGLARWILDINPPGTGQEPTVHPHNSAERPEDLRAEIRQLWESVSRSIMSPSLLPSALKKDWYARLSDLSGPDCIDRIEGVLREAEEAHRNWRRYEDYREVSLSTDLEGHLRHIVRALASLKEEVVRYLSQQR
jgi:hypothetical protein